MDVILFHILAHILCAKTPTYPKPGQFAMFTLCLMHRPAQKNSNRLRCCTNKRQSTALAQNLCNAKILFKIKCMPASAQAFPHAFPQNMWTLCAACVWRVGKSVYRGIGGFLPSLCTSVAVWHVHGGAGLSRWLAQSFAWLPVFLAALETWCKSMTCIHVPGFAHKLVHKKCVQGGKSVFFQFLWITIQVNQKDRCAW